MHKIKLRSLGFIMGIAGACLLCSFAFNGTKTKPPVHDDQQPRIVNIVNFIRLCEPRDKKITEDILYETVVKQIALMRKYKLKGTFLLQYDALCDPRYQRLLKALPADSFEIGAWWEMPQPLVEDAGLKWRGSAPWDPRADVDFATGYSPAERKKLADTYMIKFKSVFGYYPKSVGSWFMDAYTLNYLYKKYAIVASCNCKDQIGTDGYTLWGGYWNQAYYPSVKNAYMPAQHESNQIPVPVFRMLGSDPVRQYDNGLGTNRQGVVTLEPVYKFGGGDSAWVHWYFKQFVQGESLAYAYVQAGQENSFTWKAMKKGFKIQLPLISHLRDEKKLRVETLAASGQWFRQHYKVTPPTAVTVNHDLPGSNRKTVWFDSRFYRMNLLWHNGTLRFRDIHLFNEQFASPYLTQKSTSTRSSFFTLPFVDGHRWSAPQRVAGLRFKTILNGKDVSIRGKNPHITRTSPGVLHISWPIGNSRDTLMMDLNERQIKMKMNGTPSIRWFLDLSAAAGAALPFRHIGPHRIDCRFEGMNYSIVSRSGSFSTPGDSVAFRMTPENNTIILNLSGRSKPN
ncbi:MAG TPA: hypothetical protein VFX43_05180 [Chitinophagaceae bacterium]|nr:hypothetical protein [Chitinophagaceae bacterium]